MMPEAELEKDEQVQGLKPIDHQPSLNKFDSTPDVFFSGAGDILTSLSQGGFGHLLSAVRADTGVTAGRYLFEARILEQVPDANQVLRLGFSTAESSFFLGDGSLESIGFGNDGTYFSAEPGQLRRLELPEACQPFLAHQAIGILLNLTSDNGPTSNTLSVFIDGVRVSRPQPIPVHLRGKALFPTITFQNTTVAVNFGCGGRQLQALPFKCNMFADLAVEHHVLSCRKIPAGGCEVVVPVGLPDAGVYDWVDCFKEKHPTFQEISARYMEEWCTKSGLVRDVEPGPSHSRDEPDMCFGHDVLQGKAWWAELLHLAQLSGRSCVVAGVKSGLLEMERQKLISGFAKAKKIAIVVMGEPDASFKSWVHGKIQSDFEARKKAAEQRRTLAEASGEELSEEDLAIPEEPTVGDSVWFLPRTSVPDMSDKSVALTYAQFALPKASEGFDEIKYEWMDEKAAQSHLKQFVLERKATLVVEGLRPGSWFKGKLEAWKIARKSFQHARNEFGSKVKDDPSLNDVVNGMSLTDVKDVHDGDGNGTPVYGSFKYEDWLLLSWRYELHLLHHAFLEDVADPDRPGIPEHHVSHYFQLYFGRSFDTHCLGVAGLTETVRLLREPLELADTDQGYKILKSKLDKETAIDEFVLGVEKFRRDRCRRIDAGDESAELSFPKPQPKAAGPAKARPPPKAAVPRPAAAAAAAAAAPPPAKAAVAKAPVTKSRAVEKVAPPGGIKRGTPDSVSPTLQDAKKLRPEGKTAAQVAKRPAITKNPPITKAPSV
eukprot:TRINITY_DN3143_c0_g1_i1.p1 TRINITY_DN3143_c0_g1~~TRINITY_DN3143_c0_g1_i1.p1  ORF type:complete len:773 (+),score=123.22 TRINITY_DN3143_c0_g1_i1:43-2361(+)